uniref:Putative zinc transporter 7 n=1 Tax=Psorophora albipes TaxID=869069 RepID=T1DI81_9DIPT
MNSKFFAIFLCIAVFGVVTGHGNNGRHHGGGGRGHHGHGGHGGHGHHGHGGHGRHGHHHRHHHWQHRHASFVNFEVREPKGLLVSSIQRCPNTTFFGIELYVDRAPNANGTQPCDVCLNTTEVTYGKFIVEDGEAIIKRGDILYFHVLLGDNSNVTRLPLQKLMVTDSIINRCNCEEKPVFPNIDVRFGEPNQNPDRRPTFGVKPSLPETRTSDSTTLPPTFDTDENELFSDADTPFECDLDPVTNLCRTSKGVEPEKLTSTDYEREVQILQGIIDQMKTNCGPRRVTNMLLLRTASPEMVTNNGQAMELVRSSLAISGEMQDLAGKVQRVMSTSGARDRSVTFEMPTYVDKQKVLYHARMNNLRDVVDYDFVRRG